MGVFLSMSAVMGQSKSKVESCLRGFAKLHSGGLIEKELGYQDADFCVLHESKNGITVVYPDEFMEWEKASRFLSQKLQCPTFSFHIHDGDLWMFRLYNNGVLVDQFNPIPNYWNENIPQTEIEKQKGNPGLIAKLIPSIDEKDIANYLVRWDFEGDPIKAHPEDKFENEDWQVIDFMEKIGLEYPLKDSDKPSGTIYQFWTKWLKLKNLEDSDDWE